jgi:hypothetical protein
MLGEPLGREGEGWTHLQLFSICFCSWSNMACQRATQERAQRRLRLLRIAQGRAGVGVRMRVRVRVGRGLHICHSSLGELEGEGGDQHEAEVSETDALLTFLVVVVLEVICATRGMAQRG